MITTLLLSGLFVIFALMILIMKPNLLFVLFALEIILLGVNINFILGSLVLNDFAGQYISLILFSVAALDTSVGLIIILNYYNLHGLVRSTSNIKG
jgi:NADH-quinone oxidoreductase subunit K